MKNIWRNVTCIAIIVAVILPVLLLVLQSLGKWTFPDMLPDWNLEVTIEYLTSDALLRPLSNGLVLAAIVTILSLVLGFFPAKYIGTMNFRGKRILEILIIIPALTPGIAVVFGMRSVFIDLNIYQSYLALVLGQITFALPYMILSLSSVFRNYDTSLESQSETLGVDKINTLLHVTIPAVKPGIAVGCMYTFIVSWSMYLLTSIYAPRGFQTLITYLFPLFNSGLVSDQIVAILSIAYFMPSVFVLWISSRLMGSNKLYSRGGL